MRRELVWPRQRNDQLNQVELFDSQRAEVFVGRSVDNRLRSCSAGNQNLQSIQDFAHLSFHGSTIKLETVTEYKLLGFTTAAPNRSNTFNPPKYA